MFDPAISSRGNLTGGRDSLQCVYIPRRDAARHSRTRRLVHSLLKYREIAPQWDEYLSASSSTLSIMKLITLALPALAFANYVPSILDEPLNPLCIVYTVVEQPIVISTCFSSKTTACIDGYTTTVSSPTCIDTTVTASTTVSEAPIFHPTHHPATKAEEPCEYTTITTDILTTVCPSPTIITHGTHTYTITEATTFTITGKFCLAST